MQSSFVRGVKCVYPALHNIHFLSVHNARSVLRMDLQTFFSDAETVVWSTVACHAHFEWLFF